MITIPGHVRRELGLRQGQARVVHSQGDRRIVLDVLPMLTPDDLFARYPLTDPVDGEVWRAARGDALARHHVTKGGDQDEPN